jgi:hypothetical protein
MANCFGLLRAVSGLLGTVADCCRPLRDCCGLLRTSSHIDPKNTSSASLPFFSRRCRVRQHSPPRGRYPRTCATIRETTTKSDKLTKPQHRQQPRLRHGAAPQLLVLRFLLYLTFCYIFLCISAASRGVCAPMSAEGAWRASSHPRLGTPGIPSGHPEVTLSIPEVPRGTVRGIPGVPLV